MTRLSIVLFASATLVTTACSKKSGDAGSAAAKAAAVKLPNVGLQLEIPGETMVSDGMEKVSNMVNGEAIGALEVDLADKPQTLDEAKTDAADFKPRNLKEEKLADGWALSYENTGSAGTNYFVRVRRDIAGKSYTCSTTGSQAAQAQAVLAACKSLRP
ncbi:MAG: hypothetical protein ACM31C_07880 [Acidobacteriota bacterium]